MFRCNNTIFILLFLLILSVAKQSFAVGLFGHQEVLYSGVKYFPKWIDVVERHEVDKASCVNGVCALDRLRQFLDKQRSKPRLKQIKSVHRYFNRNRYVVDMINWGTSDYWAAPVQFLSKNGDCEDYSIAKFMALKYLGFSNDEMRIVVLYDSNLKANHAVLSVLHGGKSLILDNQISPVVSSGKIYHYKPIYAVNETNWWRFR